MPNRRTEPLPDIVRDLGFLTLGSSVEDEALGALQKSVALHLVPSLYADAQITAKRLASVVTNRAHG